MLEAGGLATEEDINMAIKTCHEQDNFDIVLLKCTSSYPAPIQESNLCMIKDLADKYGVITGLSDHTLGITAPVVAVTQGAKIIEKHFILDRTIGGPDASFSLNEEEFTQMVKATREAEIAIGEVNYTLSEKQLQGRSFSRSLYFIKDVEKGEIISKMHVKSIRPGHGAHPKYLKDIIGLCTKKSYKKGDRVLIEEILD